MAFLLDRPPHLGGLPRFQHPNDITDFPKPLGYLCGHGQGVVLSVLGAYYPTHGERDSQLDHGGSAQHCAAAVCVRVVEMSDARIPTPSPIAMSSSARWRDAV